MTNNIKLNIILTKKQKEEIKNGRTINFYETLSYTQKLQKCTP